MNQPTETQNSHSTAGLTASLLQQIVADEKKRSLKILQPRDELNSSSSSAKSTGYDRRKAAEKREQLKLAKMLSGLITKNVKHEETQENCDQQLDCDGIADTILSSLGQDTINELFGFGKMRPVKHRPILEEVKEEPEIIMDSAPRSEVFLGKREINSELAQNHQTEATNVSRNSRPEKPKKVYSHPLDFETFPTSLRSAKVMSASDSPRIEKLETNESHFPDCSQLIQVSREFRTQNQSELSSFMRSEGFEREEVGEPDGEECGLGNSVSIVADLDAEERVIYSYPTNLLQSKADLYDQSGCLIPIKISIAPCISYSTAEFTISNERLSEGTSLVGHLLRSSKQPVTSFHLKMNFFKYDAAADSFVRAMYGRVYFNHLTGKRTRPSWKYMLPAVKEALYLMKVGEKAWFRTSDASALRLPKHARNFDLQDINVTTPESVLPFPEEQVSKAEDEVIVGLSEKLDDQPQASPTRSDDISESVQWYFRLEVDEVWVKKLSEAMSTKMIDVEAKIDQDSKQLESIQLRFTAKQIDEDLSRQLLKYSGRMSSWMSEATKQNKTHLLDRIKNYRIQLAWMSGVCEATLGKNQLAISHFTHLLGMDPNHELGMAEKAKCLETIGELESALCYYQVLKDTEAASRVEKSIEVRNIYQLDCLPAEQSSKPVDLSGID